MRTESNLGDANNIFETKTFQTQQFSNTTFRNQHFSKPKLLEANTFRSQNFSKPKPSKTPTPFFFETNTVSVRVHPHMERVLAGVYLDLDRSRRTYRCASRFDEVSKSNKTSVALEFNNNICRDTVWGARVWHVPRGGWRLFEGCSPWRATAGWRDFLTKAPCKK